MTHRLFSSKDTSAKTRLRPRRAHSKIDLHLRHPHLLLFAYPPSSTHSQPKLREPPFAALALLQRLKTRSSPRVTSTNPTPSTTISIHVRHQTTLPPTKKNARGGFRYLEDGGLADGGVADGGVADGGMVDGTDAGMRSRRRQDYVEAEPIRRALHPRILINHLFAYPPSSTHSQAKLPFFIPYALHRTKFHTAVTFAAWSLARNSSEVTSTEPTASTTISIQERHQRTLPTHQSREESQSAVSEPGGWMERVPMSRTARREAYHRRRVSGT
ncbi:hypothetical protein M413DRAFT_278033 [Hebeloma cylindrosporum]|uniref:Uncharacterized protein n=1 Tax=Hebeloma cylindrosporum TaxID=76867 RepID=A0A0C3BZ87_HEBCY|nr:hypothetical protein M413DRAFT_278033 [Hebeloma cylindrosporum h7]